MILKVRIYLALFCLFIFSPLQAEEASAKLSALLEQVKTFQAHFSQKIQDANGESVSNSQGQITIQRPGKFYWKSQKPNPVLVVGDGKHLWTYDIELEQVTKQDLKKALTQTPASLLAGSVASLKENFRIEFAKKKCQAQECYVLYPLSKDSSFTKININFNQGVLKDIRMNDSLGQNIYTSFSQVKMNPKVDSQLFAFVPPKGVDILQAGK